MEVLVLEDGLTVSPKPPIGHGREVEGKHNSRARSQSRCPECEVLGLRKHLQDSATGIEYVLPIYDCRDTQAAMDAKPNKVRYTN